MVCRLLRVSCLRPVTFWRTRPCPKTIYRQRTHLLIKVSAFIALKRLQWAITWSAITTTITIRISIRIGTTNFNSISRRSFILVPAAPLSNTRRPTFRINSMLSCNNNPVVPLPNRNKIQWTYSHQRSVQSLRRQASRQTFRQPSSPAVCRSWHRRHLPPQCHRRLHHLRPLQHRSRQAPQWPQAHQLRPRINTFTRSTCAKSTTNLWKKSIFQLRLQSNKNHSGKSKQVCTAIKTSYSPNIFPFTAQP